jgi:hypothetical protein
MLSRNILIDTPRNVLSPAIYMSLNHIKLTDKINHHTNIHCCEVHALQIQCFFRMVLPLPCTNPAINPFCRNEICFPLPLTAPAYLQCSFIFWFPVIFSDNLSVSSLLRLHSYHNTTMITDISFIFTTSGGSQEAH